MSNLQIFNFGVQEVRVVMIDNNPWWVAKDVCDVLGISNHHDAISRLDDDERGSAKVDTLGGIQTVAVINESGMFALILRSNKPKAKKFRKWVTSEVLPAIRKHGLYVTPMTVEAMIADPEKYIGILTAFNEERKQKLALAAKVEGLETQLDESKEWYTVKRVASINGIDWRSLSWKQLKNTSNIMEVDIQKIFDANYGTVNAYHISVWQHEHPELKYK